MLFLKEEVPTKLTCHDVSLIENINYIRDSLLHMNTLTTINTKVWLDNKPLFFPVFTYPKETVLYIVVEIVKRVNGKFKSRCYLSNDRSNKYDKLANRTCMTLCFTPEQASKIRALPEKLPETVSSYLNMGLCFEDILEIISIELSNEKDGELDEMFTIN